MINGLVLLGDPAITTWVSRIYSWNEDARISQSPDNSSGSILC